MHGQVGLFFTDSPPQEVTEWFDDFKVPSFARANHKATKTVVIPEGLLNL
jgi:mRNA turnover protein 4